jgi:hypothetical protein
LDSWTTIDSEAARIATLDHAGHFSSARYPLTSEMSRFDPKPLVAAWNTHKDEIERLKNPSTNQTGYSVKNPFFTTPDLEVLYMMVRSLEPRRVVEVGCGNSTKITRQAIIDGRLKTELIAIDPQPRAEIAGLTDRFEQRRLESIEDFNGTFELGANDILFIDSSHQAFVGNDVANLFCKIIPGLPKGVCIHTHDIYLPYEYPLDMAREYPTWGEQYVLHALVHGRACEVMWPGYFLQKDKPELHDALPFLKAGRAQSFWFRWS